VSVVLEGKWARACSGLPGGIERGKGGCTNKDAPCTRTRECMDPVGDVVSEGRYWDEHLAMSKSVESNPS
jgi:hypothetical protein